MSHVAGGWIKKTCRICGMVILSVLAFFVIAEIVVRIYLANHLVYDVEMARYALELKTDSANAAIGHVHKPKTTTKLMGVEVQTSEDGFRDQDYPVERSDKERWIFLGDSITFGWGVEQSLTFAEVIEKQLSQTKPTEVINFGTGNYNTEQEVYLFTEKGMKYKPDHVVLFYFLNDAEPTPEKSKMWFLGFSRIATFYWSRIRAITSRDELRSDYRKYYASLYDAEQPGWEKTRLALWKLRDLCAKNDIDLRVVLLPDMHNLAEYPFKTEHQLMMEFLSENEIPGLDLAPKLAGEKDAKTLWVAPDDAHPNARAHMLIAKHTFGFLMEGM